MNSKNVYFIKKLGLKIKIERTKLGLSQEKFADLADLNKNSVGAIERGESVASIDTLFSIANALKIELKELVDISKVEL
jgi:transcriptional regulator with XRE-family HTH domain